jgi:hypothetical protein
MVKINDQSLRTLLDNDKVLKSELTGISREFVLMYLQAGKPDGKFMADFMEALSKANSSADVGWTKQFKQMIERIDSYESLLYTITGYRDHIAHAVRVCLLGYYLMSRPPIKPLLPKGSLEKLQTQWLLTSLFHDICVPLNRLSDIQEKVNKMMSSYPGISFSQYATFRLNESIYQKIKRVFGKDSGEFCLDLLESATRGNHGALAGIVLLDTFLGHLDKEILQNVITSVCLHDYFPCQVNFQDCPIGCLLVICDELQEWDRPFADQLARGKVLKLDFIDLRLSESLIQMNLDYATTTSIEGYVPIEINEKRNFEKKEKNLSRLLLPFNIAVNMVDREGKRWQIGVPKTK